MDSAGFISFPNRKVGPPPAFILKHMQPQTRTVKPAATTQAPTNTSSAFRFVKKPLQLITRKKVEERKYGYGNLDDWNALPAVDQARIRNHSVKLLHSFRNTKLFLRFLGLFPFKTKKLVRSNTKLLKTHTRWPVLHFFLFTARRKLHVCYKSLEPFLHYFFVCIDINCCSVYTLYNWIHCVIYGF